MLRDYALIREIKRKADAAIKRVAEKSARLADEDDFTSRLLQVIDDEFDGWSYNGVTWRTEIVVDGVLEERPAIAVEARKLTSRGAGAEEGKYGADIVMTVHVDVPGYRVAKSILIQSKRLEPDGWISRGEWDRLLGQIDRMRQMSEHSFVWMYSAEGVRSSQHRSCSIWNVLGPIGCIRPQQHRSLPTSSRAFTETIGSQRPIVRRC